MSYFPVFLNLIQEKTLIINERGEIYRINKSGSKKRAELIQRDGYLKVITKLNGKVYAILAHRLIWEYLKGDIAQGYVVHHKNGINFNNDIDNLELVRITDLKKMERKESLSSLAKRVQKAKSKVTPAQLQAVYDKMPKCDRWKYI